ncbi:uncharacterized protein G2W53_036809 [Senna tora]|uniref:Uncharacterized protein n=1 Tax=Senna tora TaxID=362788 RepID=A0A834W919_9FABA|nr:uncharacterized protein G2W53_036809 [Senna tora]
MESEMEREGEIKQDRFSKKKP